MHAPEPLAGLNGRGIRIAVIDSGVNLAHPHICAKTTAIPIDGVTDDAVDQLGHGTAVMAAIQEKAPGGEYFALKLFGSSLRASTPGLIRALEQAIALRVDVINLSLGTPKLEYRDELTELINRAIEASTAVVCARSAMDQPVLPGCLRGVIAVDVDWDLPRTTFRIDETKGERHFVASGFPRSLPGVPPRRNLHGISFAVANMTGFVARACELSSSRNVLAISEILRTALDRSSCPAL